MYYCLEMEDHVLKRAVMKSFDVPMEWYDETEICKLIGTYLLYQINNII